MNDGVTTAEEACQPTSACVNVHALVAWAPKSVILFLDSAKLDLIRMRRKSNPRRKRGRAGQSLPGASSRLAYTGTLAAGGVVALSATTPLGAEYRVNRIRLQYSSPSGTTFQAQIRGEGEEDAGNSSPFLMSGPQPRSLVLRQGPGVSFFPGNDDQSHIAWLRNTGSSSVVYNCLAYMTRRDHIKIAAAYSGSIEEHFPQ